MKFSVKKFNFALMIPALMSLALAGCFNLSPQARSVVTETGLSEDERFDQTPLIYPSLGSQKTVQVLGFRAVAPTYEKLTETTSAQLIAGDPNSVNDLSTYSLTGGADSINSPMLFNELKLAAGYCYAMVKRERALAAGSRKYFNMFNFNRASTAQNLSAAIKDATARVSRVFCSEDADQSTQDMIQAEIEASFPRDGAGAVTDSIVDTQYYQNVVDSATMICTSYLASTCTLLNN